MPPPKKTYAVLGTLLVAFWFLAGIGQGGADSSTASDIGSAFWLCFGLTILATVGFSLALGVRALVRSRRTA